MALAHLAADGSGEVVRVGSWTAFQNNGTTVTWTWDFGVAVLGGAMMMWPASIVNSWQLAGGVSGNTVRGIFLNNSGAGQNIDIFVIALCAG